MTGGTGAGNRWRSPLYFPLLMAGLGAMLACCVCPIYSCACRWAMRRSRKRFLEGLGAEAADCPAPSEAPRVGFLCRLFSRFCFRRRAQAVDLPL